MKPAMLRPVRRRPVESLATDSLREFILSGAVKPGARLTEIALAEQLGVARATLRTCLYQLASEGLVIKIPYTGWQVAEHSADDAWEIWTLRGSLERVAALLVAQDPDPAVPRAVRAAYEKLLTACDKADMRMISECDFALHRTIVDLARHSRLQQHYRLVEQQVRWFITTSNAYASDGPEDIIEQHRPIVEALIARDAERAAQEAWMHNETEGKRLADWLRAQSVDEQGEAR